jgi:nicotinate-nucleotide pyrophosphorylase
MIDKVLMQMVEDTWEIIETRENAKIEESRKIRPPQYEYSKNLEVHVIYTPQLYQSFDKVVEAGLLADLDQ